MAGKAHPTGSNSTKRKTLVIAAIDFIKGLG